jgi:hypothetical protein
MEKTSVRLRLPLIEQLDTYCRTMSLTRMTVFSEAIFRFRAGWYQGENFQPHQNNYYWRDIGDPKQFVEGLSPTKLGGKPRKVIATRLSEKDVEYVSGLARQVGVNHRQIIEASIMVFLSKKGFMVNGLSKWTLEDFWAPYQAHGQGEALQCLLEEQQSGNFWTLWGERDGRPLAFKNQTILLDASVLLLCLGQEKRAKLVVQRLLKSAANVIITSAIISEIAIKGIAILGADHTNLTRLVSIAAVRRARSQRVVTVLRAVRLPPPKHLEFCHKPFDMGGFEFDQTKW